ncbi:MAG: TIR domain-containing protein [Oscillospiraceae bacterium]|jgi:hypothetical protein|nr:TIR domain-containing protein [Oscillospiraceae bacterium]
MRIFVIHSFSDVQRVDEIVSHIQQQCFNVSILRLENDRQYWKSISKSFIKSSDAILVCVGEKTHLSTNIEWEVNEAKRLGRIIYVMRLAENNQVPCSLFGKDEFSGEKIPLFTYKCEIDFIHEMNGYVNNEYLRTILYPSGFEREKDPTLLEQYKLMLGTSETLISRRQAQNNIYVAINSILLPAISALVILKELLFFVLSFALALVGIIICVSWVNTIIAYGQLNSAKFDVINELEKKLAASVFDAEWSALSRKFQKKKYKSFTEREKTVPKLFAIIYAMLCIVSLVLSFVWKLWG